MFCLDRISVDFLLGSFFGSVCAFLSFFWGGMLFDRFVGFIDVVLILLL